MTFQYEALKKYKTKLIKLLYYTSKANKAEQRKKLLLIWTHFDFSSTVAGNEKDWSSNINDGVFILKITQCLIKYSSNSE